VLAFGLGGFAAGAATRQIALATRGRAGVVWSGAPTAAWWCISAW
jgi:hypothetical protein